MRPACRPSISATVGHRQRSVRGLHRNPPAPDGEDMDPVRRVLVVEDEPALADLARMYLERDGFAVDLASDVATAEAVAARTPPSVVLLDIGLPGGRDGVDLCRAMRSRGDWTPVI